MTDASSGADAALGLYRRVNDLVFDRYAAGEFRCGLAAIEEHRDVLEPWDSELAVIAACLHARLGDDAAALRELQEALERGGWWDPEVLREEDDLESLRGREAFRTVVGVAGERWRAENAVPDRSGDLVVSVSRPQHLLVALHGAEEDARDAVRGWGEIAERSRSTLLAVRSSQRTSPAYRTWPDHARAVREIEAALAALPAATRGLPVIATGFSAGGRVALRWALEGAPVPVEKVLAMAPAITPSDLDREPSSRVRGAVWVGSDDALAEQVDSSLPRLAAAGIDVEVIPGLGHAFPADFAARALSAL